MNSDTHMFLIPALREVLLELPATERLAMHDAIFKYLFDGVVPAFKDGTPVARLWLELKAKLDRAPKNCDETVHAVRNQPIPKQIREEKQSDAEARTLARESLSRVQMAYPVLQRELTPEAIEYYFKENLAERETEILARVNMWKKSPRWQHDGGEWNPPLWRFIIERHFESTPPDFGHYSLGSTTSNVFYHVDCIARKSAGVQKLDIEKALEFFFLIFWSYPEHRQDCDDELAIALFFKENLWKKWNEVLTSLDAWKKSPVWRKNGGAQVPYFTNFIYGHYFDGTPSEEEAQRRVVVAEERRKEEETQKRKIEETEKALIVANEFISKIADVIYGDEGYIAMCFEEETPGNLSEFVLENNLIARESEILERAEAWKTSLKKNGKKMTVSEFILSQKFDQKPPSS